MKYQQMNYTADKVEAILRSRKAPVSVVGGRSLPRYLELFMKPEGATRISQVRNLAQDIALAVGAGSVRIGQEGDFLTVQIASAEPKTARKDVVLSRLMARMKDIPPHTSVLGLSADGAPLLLHLPSPDVGHVLIAGTTGCGKTQLALSLLISLAKCNRPRDLGFLVIDPKRREDDLYTRHLGGHLMSAPAHTPASAADILQRLCDVMDQRALSQDPLPRCVLFVDELADLIMTGGEPILNMLTRITQRGREYGIHLVACTQKPGAAVLGSLLRSNMPIRLVGRVTSAEDARTATGRAATGADKLAGSGDFLAVTATELIRFQAALPA